VLQALGQLRSLDPNTRFVVPSSTQFAPPPGLMVGPTVAEVIAEHEGNLAEIDATVARLEKDVGG
jgi:hypothetical protein